MEQNKTRFAGWELLGEECEIILAPGHHPNLSTFTRKAIMYYAEFIGRSEARDCLWGHLPTEDAHHVWLTQVEDYAGFDSYFFWQTEPRAGWSRGTILCLQGQTVSERIVIPERCESCGQWQHPGDPHGHEYGPPKPADPLWDRLIDKRTYG